MMKWIEILNGGKVRLLQSANDSQFVVAIGYNPKAPEGQRWNYGDYYPYWGNAEDKAKCLSAAVEQFRYLTEKDYIPKERFEEIATQSIHMLRDELDSYEFETFLKDDLDLEDHVRKYLEIETELEDSDFEYLDINDEIDEEEW